MTYLDTAWWHRLEQLATVGPEPGEYAEADKFLADAEAMVNAARELIKPRAVSPAKARLQRFPVTPTKRP